MSTYKTLASMKTLPAAQIEAAIKFVQNHQNLFDDLEMKVCIIINNHDVFVQEDTEAEIELDQLMRSLNANFPSLNPHIDNSCTDKPNTFHPHLPCSSKPHSETARGCLW